MKEATIMIDGHTLSDSQSMSVRVAVTSFLMQLRDPGFAHSLGQLGISYNERLTEVLIMMQEGAA